MDMRKHQNRTCGALALGAAALASLFGLPAAQSQSADALIDKLVDKGILTVDEATSLREEADKNFTQSYQVKSGMPDWVTALKINGDFRGRYEGFFSDAPYLDSTATDWVERTRWRYRLRLGVTANIKDNWEVGVRLTSSDAVGNFGGDPISGNSTMTSNGSKKFLYLDLAYMKWMAVNSPDWNVALTLGKMENPLVFTDTIFDNDYTPEGLGQQVVYNLSGAHALKFNAGQYSLREISGESDDVFLFGGQVRFDSTWNTHWSSSIGGGYVGIMNSDQLTASSVPYNNRGNLRPVNPGSTPTLGAPLNSFETMVLDGGVTRTLASFPGYTGAFPIRIGGLYAYNFGADDNNTGWEAGVTFGKAGKRKTYEISYRYKVLEGDFWYEQLPDSDYGAFYPQKYSASSGGKTARSLESGYFAGTNIRGHVVKSSYTPIDPLTLTVTWFFGELIEEIPAGADTHMNRLQVDAILKF